MEDDELEAIADTLEDVDVEELETDNLEVESEEIEDGEETDFEEQPEEEIGEADDPESDDQVLVTLEDGEQVTLSDLKSGNLRMADYTHKTTEIAREREAISQRESAFMERSKYVETTFSKLAEYLAGIVPPEPDFQLAQSNPGEFQFQKALRENAIKELRGIVDMKEDLGTAQQGYSQEDIRRLRADEDAKLVKAMPRLKDPAQRTAFNAATKKTAMEFGFSEDEISGAADHRILQLVHYASIGKRAEKNRSNAKRRVETPSKGKARPSSVTAKSASSRKAKERLAKTGSIEDAMGLDF